VNDVYGYCPRCGGLGMSRERRLNGNDRCEHGHGYPSVSAVATPLLPVSADIDALVAEVERLREQRHDDGKGRRVDAYLAGALDERAAVVAWLRDDGFPGIADHIERGEHRRKEEK
jgi:hypothetical protein